MPTYEYECDRCGSRFERFQRMSAEPVACCPKCGEPARRRIGSGGGVLVKGGGAKEGDSRDCSLERTGRTCCGRDSSCGAPPCGKNG